MITRKLDHGPIRACSYKENRRTGHGVSMCLFLFVAFCKYSEEELSTNNAWFENKNEEIAQKLGLKI